MAIPLKMCYNISYYLHWKGMGSMARELSRRQLIERSIIKKYRKELWNPFIAAVKRYQLIQAGPS